MSSSQAPRNRRERRAQAQAQENSSTRPSDASDSFSQPSRAPPAHKTLLDIAAERELLGSNSVDELVGSDSIITSTINSDGSLSFLPSPSKSDDPTNSLYLDTVIYTLTLTFLHFTLTLLVHNQYATEPPSVIPLFLSSTVFSLKPALLFVLVFILHPRTSNLAVQVLFAILSIVAGAWLIHATNDEPYLAVMKKAPALGTLWVWAIVEMKWEWAVGTLSVVGGWGWWMGYSFL